MVKESLRLLCRHLPLGKGGLICKKSRAHLSTAFSFFEHGDYSVTPTLEVSGIVEPPSITIPWPVI